MSGSVSMTSEVGVGTTFTIHVPFTKAKEISAPSLVRAASLKLARRPEAVHILVADGESNASSYALGLRR